MAAPSPEQIERFRGELASLAAEHLAPARASALLVHGGPLRADEPFGLAVSGGPDSLALLLLASAAFPGRVCAATVDHGLRAESADEARFVAGICARLGVQHYVLTPSLPPGGNLQANAREARYESLDHWLRSSGARLLLTGHHVDDQAETLLMRLNRGSGVAGLAGVRAASRLPIEDAGAVVLRPLLEWRRDELASIVLRAGLEAVQDPSNSDERFDRARLRKQLADAPWLNPDAIARSAALLASADDALDWALGLHWDARVSYRAGLITYRPDGAPREILIRLLRMILVLLNDEARPRGAELSRLADALEKGKVATLAGIKCSGGKQWRFEPAPARRAVRGEDQRR